MHKSQINSHKTLDIELFIKTLINCCYYACQIINRSSMKETSICYKSQSDPVTQIDHTIQKLITEKLDKLFPRIHIVGEEHIDQVMVDYKILEQIAINLQKFQGIKFNQQLLNRIKSLKIQIKKQDICVFIDPLDCTRGYICGKKWECTVLIGVTIKGEPVLGFIGQPFKRINEKHSHYQPSIILGGTIFNDKGCYQYQYSQDKWNKIFHNKVQAKLTPKVAVSCRRSNSTQHSLLSSLGAKKVPCGGSGYKLAMLIKGQVDAVIFIESPLSTWDSCAGQAILLANQGVLTKPNNIKITYDSKNKNQTNERGYIGCLDKNFHKKIVEFLSL